MKHRDRVLMALSHKRPDRCPMQLFFALESAMRQAQVMESGDKHLHNPGGGDDDVRDKDAMLISPKMWWAFMKPRLVRFTEEIKTTSPRLGVAYRSDGAIYPIIPDLIEVDVDVLNPIQLAYTDPVLIKRKYGDRLCF